MLDPAQPVPPWHVLVRVRVPPLQVRLQPDHDPQLLHEPVAVRISNNKQYGISHYVIVCPSYPSA